MRTLSDSFAATAARCAVIALEAAWLAVLVAASLAILGAGDAAVPLQFAASLGLVCAFCAALSVLALAGRRAGPAERVADGRSRTRR